MVLVTDPGQYDMLRDIDRLTKENNQLLHSMRRASFIGAVFKVAMYIVFLGAPIWIYLTYFSGTVDDMINFYQQARTLNTQTQSKFTGFEDMLKEMQMVIHTASQRLATSTEDGTSTAR
jgi:hypothetical protein